MTNLEDTIAAISTPLSGEGGIGIVRISGKDAISIADKIFKSKDNTKPREFKTFTLHYGWIVDKYRVECRGSRIIDEVLLSVMRAPKTYTREDVVEISGHGGTAVLREILKLCLKCGARLAEPGEFTRRAFLNGRIDLIQAEAVCDLIRSKTEESSRVASEQIEGRLSEKINSLISDLKDTLAQFEASIDYPEEDIEFISKGAATAKLNSLAKEVEAVLSSANKGRVYREGVKITIIGKPNVGKSSLLNILLSLDRAIVTPIPGTTRDVITETFNLRGVPVTVMDTAGIRSHFRYSQKSRRIEEVAVERSRKSIGGSQIIIFLCDINSDVTGEDVHISKLVQKSGKKVILTLNKIDLVKNKQAEVLAKNYKKLFKSNQLYCCPVSALYDQGIEKLKNTIYDAIMADTGCIPTPDISDTVLVTNLRHEKLLEDCCENFNKAVLSVNKGESPEFVVFHLKHALDNLGGIVGKVTTEDILDSIFSNFCIGK